MNWDETNQLRKARTGRWCLNGVELTSGSHFDVRVQGHWIRVVIEVAGANGKRDYCAYPSCIRLHDGLEARFINDYTD